MAHISYTAPNRVINIIIPLGVERCRRSRISRRLFLIKSKYVARDGCVGRVCWRTVGRRGWVKMGCSRDYVGRPWRRQRQRMRRARLRRKRRDRGAATGRHVMGRRRRCILITRDERGHPRAPPKRVGEESEAVRLIPPRRESETAAACALHSGQSAYTTGGSGGFGGGGYSRCVVVVNVRIYYNIIIIISSPCRIPIVFT